MANSVWQATIQNAAGDIVPGAEITVIDEGTGLNAVIYSSKAGAALTNPFNADAGGFAQFYSGPGEYRITAFDIGTGLTQTFDNWRLGDAGARDVGIGTDEVPLNSDIGLGNGETNWTSGNVNIDNFGAGAASEIIALGVAISATKALFVLPVSFNASSITVTSTFEVITPNFVNRASNETPLFDILSSDKGVVVGVNVFGTTSGDPLFLRAETSISNIRANA